MQKLLALFFSVALLLPTLTRAQHNLIPEPAQYLPGNGTFTWNDQVHLDVQTNDPQVQQYLVQFRNWVEHAGLKLSMQRIERVEQKKRDLVVLLNQRRQPELGDEGYALDVTEASITLAANQPAGIFYGLQTLRQLFPPETEAAAAKVKQTIEIPACSIRDYPRFQWRGLMLDVSRHFFPVEDVKAFIDKMAHYKFNTFHWHLTDDEGWRIEIKSLPKLTEIGAWRVERHGRFGESRPYPQPGEKATYGGYYTHEQIREVVQYAADRNITIVPEIDMPGHSMAALAAYPELSTKKEEKFVNPGAKLAEWYGDGTFKMLIENTLNPTDEKVYTFVDKVFTEVAELFPGPYIHMGGDEAYHGYWEADPDVQDFMKRNNLKDSHELQSYFVKRVQQIINSKGKMMIGWDEILEGGLAEGAAVMNWRDAKWGVEAAQKGHKVVRSPTSHAYLDYTQGDHSLENPIYADLSLEKCYRFEPAPDSIDPRYVLGGQGNLWTEVVPNLSFAYYMAYPRAFALAESLWSPKNKKDWTSFITRTEAHFARFDAAQTNICKAVYDPIVTVYKEDDHLMCKLENNVPGTEIYYTTNNTYPVQFGQRYTTPFVIPEGDLSLRTHTFRNGKPLGRLLLLHRSELEKRVP